MTSRTKKQEPNSAPESSTEVATHPESPTVTMTPKPTLHAKLCDVMAQIHLAKDGQARLGGGGFKYFSHEQVSREISRLLSERGVVFHPSMVDIQWNSSTVIIKFAMRFIDSASGEVVESTWYGEGKNGGGAINAAASYAVKYFLLKFFLVGESEDPDQTLDPNEAIDRGVRKFVASYGDDFDALQPDRKEKAVSAFMKTLGNQSNGNGANGARRV